MERPTRLKAIFERKCPRCLRGSIYRSLMRPHESCPHCGLVFEREPGYFLGSFYISYGVGGVFAVPTILVVVYGKLSFAWLFPLVAFWVGIMAPFIVTYSRVLWYHLDQLADPR
jgi:uncharacterized protein (DUF983 family)